MNDRAYTKLFSSIVTSSVWCEDSDTRVVWVTMLALVNQYGEVNAALPGLARTANVSLEKCAAAVLCFESPDPHSRTADFEGRRVEKIDGGWRILNYEKYRDAMSQDERREYKRRHEAARRARKRGQNVDNHGQNVDTRGLISAEADGDGDGEEKGEVVSPSLNGHHTGSNGVKVSASVAVIHSDKELNRVEKALEKLRKRYEPGEKWDTKDSTQRERLKTRQSELISKLGYTV